MIKIKEKSSITKASTRGNSLKSTIPKTVVSALEITDKDWLEWEIKPKDGGYDISVRKA